jgi:hypothetical protein
MMMFRIVFWDVLPCKMIVDRRFSGAYCLQHKGSVRPSETSADNNFTRQYIPEENSDHTRRRENLKSHMMMTSLLRFNGEGFLSIFRI